MSVAAGIAQPPGWPEDVVAFTSVNSSAGTATPHSAAVTGTSASTGRRSEPTTNSRFSSRPATKKNSVRAPSAPQCSRSSGPTSKDTNEWYAASAGELAHTTATTAATSASSPPTASERSTPVRNAVSPGAGSGRMRRTTDTCGG